MKLIAKSMDKCKAIKMTAMKGLRKQKVISRPVSAENGIEIKEEKMNEKIRRMGKEILFTNIMDMDAKEIIELYKKRGRIEQCFRTINVLDIASPIYHFTPEKIRVHMFFSLLAYLFLALLYNKLKEIEGISLVNVPEYLSNIRAIYIISGNVIKRKIDSKNKTTKNYEILDLEKMI